MADLSTLGWDDGAGWEKEAGSWLVAALMGKPGSSFSQAELEGIRPGEKTQGRVAADPRAAYTLVSSLGGWTIPANSTRGETTAAAQKDDAKLKVQLLSLQPTFHSQGYRSSPHFTLIAHDAGPVSLQPIRGSSQNQAFGGGDLQGFNSFYGWNVVQRPLHSGSLGLRRHITADGKRAVPQWSRRWDGHCKKKDIFLTWDTRLLWVFTEIWGLGFVLIPWIILSMTWCLITPSAFSTLQEKSPASSSFTALSCRL